MILYLDTSALLKVYLVEADSPRVRQLVLAAPAVVTNLVAYAEMRAALARALNMRRLSRADYTRQVRAFETDWKSLEVVGIDEPLVRRVGAHAERFGLRGYNSVHLAAAERILRTVGSSTDVGFLAFDAALTAAAAAIGLVSPEAR
jgi:predicted nucleic acid-binding protein